MRGFPPLHLLFFCMLFGLVTWPLAKLTFARRIVHTPTAEAPTIPQSTTTSTYLTLRLSHPPTQLVIRPLQPADAAPLVSLNAYDDTSSALEFPIELPLDSHATELSIEASWPNQTPDAAVTIELEPDTLERKSQTVWSSSQQLSEILTFQWHP